jgi:(p)ppGpp synthase/HD superfamily hydrolase
LKLIKYAELFAKDKHAGQFRDDDITPYWHHLRQVVHNLQTMGIEDESILCAGWLHDTIEDTDTNFDSISNSFGIQIANIVASVTKDTRLPKIQRDKNYQKQLLLLS